MKAMPSNISPFIEITSYETKESKSGLKIPVVNNIHLHSTYDPQKESDSFLNQHIDSFKKKSNILVLGLGYGYHIQRIVKYFIEHKRPLHIAVIEPNHQVMNDCLRLNPMDLQDVKIHCHSSVDKLFCLKDLMAFLLKKPVILPHTPSFNLYRKFFTKFLTYKCQQHLKDTINTLNNKEVKNYLKKYNQNLSLMDCFENIKKEQQFHQNLDWALAAFGEFCELSEKRDS